MSKEFPSCEAPVHVDACSGRGETKDHFTPKCIAKLFGWTNKQMSHPMNIQHLSYACHAEKDKTTPVRAQILEAQLAGAEIFFGEHQEIIEKKKSVKEVRQRVFEKQIVVFKSAA